MAEDHSQNNGTATQPDPQAQAEAAVNALQSGKPPEQVDREIASGNLDVSSNGHDTEPEKSGANEQNEPEPQPEQKSDEPKGEADQPNQSGESEATRHARELLATYNKYKDHTDADGNLKSDAFSEDQLLSEARDQAKEALKRDNWTDELIEQTPDDVLLKQGSKSRRKQLDQDRERTENEQLREQLNQLLKEQGINVDQTSQSGDEAEGDQPNPQDSSPEGEQHAEASESSTDLDGLLKQAFSDVSDESDMPTYSEVQSRLKNVLKQYDQNVDHRIRQREQELEQRLNQTHSELETRDQKIEQLQNQFSNFQFNETAREMESEIPDLKDRDVKGNVLNKARQLANLTSYQNENGEANWHELVRDAYRIEYADRMQERAHREMTDRYRTESEGQPQGDSSLPNTAGSASADDLMQQAASMLANGEDPDAIDRWVQKQQAMAG